MSRPATIYNINDENNTGKFVVSNNAITYPVFTVGVVITPEYIPEQPEMIIGNYHLPSGDRWSIWREPDNFSLRTRRGTNPEVITRLTASPDMDKSFAVIFSLNTSGVVTFRTSHVTSSASPPTLILFNPTNTSVSLGNSGSSHLSSYGGGIHEVSVWSRNLSPVELEEWFTDMSDKWNYFYINPYNPLDDNPLIWYNFDSQGGRLPVSRLWRNQDRTGLIGFNGVGDVGCIENLGSLGQLGDLVYRDDLLPVGNFRKAQVTIENGARRIFVQNSPMSIGRASQRYPFQHYAIFASGAPASGVLYQNESPLFYSYWNQNVRYMFGGPWFEVRPNETYRATLFNSRYVFEDSYYRYVASQGDIGIGVKMIVSSMLDGIFHNQGYGTLGWTLMSDNYTNGIVNLSPIGSIGYTQDIKNSSGQPYLRLITLNTSGRVEDTDNRYYPRQMRTYLREFIIFDTPQEMSSSKVDEIRQYLRIKAP